MAPRDVEMSLKKLNGMIIRIGEPTEWQAEQLGVTGLRADNYLGNLDIIRRFRVKRQWARWGKTNRDEIQLFEAPLSLVNAMYSPITNTISVYAGLLQYPFVHERYNNATMYATIGMILAHEMAHAFGPFGRRFDHEGTFKAGRMGWWDRSTVTQYDTQLLCIADAYGTPQNTHTCPLFPNNTQVGNLYGQLTLTETVADVMGLRAAYEAYWGDSLATRKSRGVPKEHKDSSGVSRGSTTGSTAASAAAEAAAERDSEETSATAQAAAEAEAKKMWMYSFAQMWCSVSSVEYECKQMMGDVHPIASVRVDSALKMLEYFDELWNCPQGTPMRNDNDERCRIF
jgi:predicted metalloendopeptidase